MLARRLSETDTVAARALLASWLGDQVDPTPAHCRFSAKGIKDQTNHSSNGYVPHLAPRGVPKKPCGKSEDHDPDEHSSGHSERHRGSFDTVSKHRERRACGGVNNEPAKCTHRNSVEERAGERECGHYYGGQKDGGVRRPEALVDNGKDAWQFAAFRHGEWKARGREHYDVQIAQYRDYGPG